MAHILKAHDAHRPAGRVRSLAYARSEAGELVVVATTHHDADGWIAVAIDRGALPDAAELVIRIPQSLS